MVNYIEFNDNYIQELTGMVLSLYSEDTCEVTMTAEKINKTIDFLTKNPDRGKIILFQNNTKIIGYSILINFWSNEYGGMVLLIDELFIKSDHRNKGIGTDFINKLINTENKEHVALFLEVFPNNKKAYSFYINNGFKRNSNSSLRYVFNMVS